MRITLAVIGFFLVAGFFLATEHRAHLFGILPFLFLLACPLLHLFAHSGHGGAHGEHSGHGSPNRSMGSETSRKDAR